MYLISRYLAAMNIIAFNNYELFDKFVLKLFGGLLSIQNQCSLRCESEHVLSDDPANNVMKASLHFIQIVIKKCQMRFKKAIWWSNEIQNHTNSKQIAKDGLALSRGNERA
eukprot:772212_1